MSKLNFKTIIDDAEISEVLDKIENYSGVRLPLAYAKRNRVVGAFLHEQLVASYMIVTKPDFRSLMFLPTEHKLNSHLSKVDDYDMMEVNGLWVGPALKTPILQARVWANLVKDIFFSKKQYVLLMRDSRNKNMERFLNMSNPVSLYDGPPMLAAGDRSHSEIQISYTTRWRIILNSYKYIAEFRNRARRASEFNKNRKFASRIQSGASLG